MRMGAVWSLLMSSQRPSTNPLKEVLRAASKTFPGRSTAQGADTVALVEALARLRLDNLGIPLPEDDLSSPSNPAEVRALAGKRPHLRYLSLDETDDYSMGVFFLPRYSRIPLHDHISMSVASKLLYGTMEVSNYNLLDTDPAEAQTAGSRVEHVSTIVRSDEGDVHSVQTLSPGFANVHEIMACTDCAMLDIIGPPYSQPLRSCQYYELRGGDQLVPIDEPRDFRCRSISMPAVSQRVAELLDEIALERDAP
ncbi:hypothetical protein T492DRAFT_956961 [Pavlovales sp. CCMP2436]|nr:hypothetical protein T492DRAFT_956961 [Pavlovales sp. CCMP2436]